MTRNATTIAKKFAVARKTVYEWVKEGCPRNEDGSFDEDKVLAWRKAKLQGAMDDPAVKMAANKTALQTKRLLHQCEILEIEILSRRGRLHDKDACAASLTELRARESRILHNLPQRFRAAFPESARQAEWLAKEMDATIERLKGREE